MLRYKKIHKYPIKIYIYKDIYDGDGAEVKQVETKDSCQVQLVIRVCDSDSVVENCGGKGNVEVEAGPVLWCVCRVTVFIKKYFEVLFFSTVFILFY